MKKTILMMICSISILAACKKDSNNNVSITGKWNLKTLREKSNFLNATTPDTTYNYSAGSYVDFSSNGIVYSYQSIGMGSPSRDTGYYTTSGNNLKLFDNNGDTFNYTIQTLTTNQLVLYNKDGKGTYYNEIWTTATR